MEFTPFPKIPRLNRGITITEKINGTNACIRIRDGAALEPGEGVNAVVATDSDTVLWAQSRKRFIQPGKADNMGFAGWVAEHAEYLADFLGEGDHYGEWWGEGIQKNPYGIAGKRFSLFNTRRWSWLDWQQEMTPEQEIAVDDANANGVFVVPTLYTGAWINEQGGFAPSTQIERLKTQGSFAANSSPYAEGIVIFTHASGTMHKVLAENDELPKGVTTTAERALAEVGTL